MKFSLFFFSLLLFISCSTAQVRYSTSNKKAIKLFEQGQTAPNLSIDPSNNMPNYRAGIEYMNKAIEKDPNFWEAHLLAGEFYEILRDYPSAIKHFEAALSINPNHSGTGSTYFYLANLQVVQTTKLILCQ